MDTKNRFIKIALITIGIAIPVVPILVAIDYKTSQQAIFESGSSSVLPLMNDFSKRYEKSQIVPTGGGSGKGLSDAASGVIDFGAMSANEKSSIVGTSYENSWKELNNRTITIAKDAIAISLHLPNGIKINSDYPVKDSDQMKGQKNYPVVNALAIAEIYSNEKVGTVTWKDLIENSSPNSNQDDLNSIVRGFGRNGGKASSGTSDGFFSTLNKFQSAAGVTLDVNHSSPKITKTPESNAQAYDALNKQDVTGINYLSLGYMTGILGSGSASNNIQVAYVDTKATLSHITQWEEPTLDNATIGHYGWVRPFNVAFSINSANKNPYIMDFIRWMLEDPTQKLDPNKTALSSIKSQYFVPLTQTDLQNQLDYIAKSDFQLLADPDQNKSKYAFGVQD